MNDTDHLGATRALTRFEQTHEPPSPTIIPALICAMGVVVIAILWRVLQ